jgi:hypothetical protein
MTPHEAGALRNTAYLALSHAQVQRTEARQFGLEAGPWTKAMRDARVAIALAEKWLVRV